MLRRCSALLLAVVCLAFALDSPDRLPPQLATALDVISAENLKANLSFLASDKLAGRYTPSPGLDIAARFINEQFWKAKLQPASGPNFCQSATYTELPGLFEGAGAKAKPGHVIQLCNLVGILRGSDPVLKNTYILLTAHYDHIGTTATAGHAATKVLHPNPSDQIFNGANDDASGTVSVIEIAKALVTLNPRPKRSIVFMTFFGEELGLLGSKYYAEHPIFPLTFTIAEINLEQLGRTDVGLHKRIDRASMTGYDYSDLPHYFEEAGRLTGITVAPDRTADDSFFARSDNWSLAGHGVPAHTLFVALDYPDYHQVGDEAKKIDYANLARIDRMIALGLIDLANSDQPPAWNTENKSAAKFLKAR